MEVKDVLEIIDRYYKQYTLPEMTITNGEWDSLLNNLYLCLMGNHSNDFVPAVNIIIRRAINLALADNGDQINLYYVIWALDDLKAFNIPLEDISELKYKIMLDGLKNNTKFINNKTK